MGVLVHFGSLLIYRFTRWMAPFVLLRLGSGGECGLKLVDYRLFLGLLRVIVALRGFVRSSLQSETRESAFIPK